MFLFRFNYCMNENNKIYIQWSQLLSLQRFILINVGNNCYLAIDAALLRLFTADGPHLTIFSTAAYSPYIYSRLLSKQSFLVS